MRQIPLEAVEEAATAVYRAAVRTPLVRLNLPRDRASDDPAPEIYLKLELLQPIGSFKIRGAWNAIRRLDPAVLADGVWTVSAGNAAQGVAFAARRAGVPCSVMVMDTAPDTKLRAIEALGATIVKASYDECWETVESHRSPRMRGHFVHPFDDDDFIAGNGTVGLEILEDLPDVNTVVAALGGGGLLAGIASVMQRRKPDVTVVAAEPETAAPFAYSLTANEASTFPDWKTSFVDGAGGKSVLPTMWPLLRDTVGRFVVVSLAEARQAMKIAAERTHIIPEGAAACAIAAALSGRAGTGKVVAVVSGGNIDLTRFASLVGACTLSMDDQFGTAAPLPDRLHRLHDLALDIWWSWTPSARRLFRAIDYPLWRATAHNPVRMLRTIDAAVLTAAAADPAVLALYDESIRALDEARGARNTWWAGHGPDINGRVIAYFSAEFALHQSLPIYAGGLGALAGDHCKEASDLGVPLVGIGFMYPQGYFHQRLSAEGWQEERYERLKWGDAPIEPAITPDGKPCIAAVPLGDRTVLAAVWRVRAGRVRLYLLDTDLEENAPWDRELSARLYGGDRETRIQQEVILGIGGVRVLRLLGIEPAVWHLNEGHAAFVALQRIRELVEKGATFDAALDEVRRSTAFTTHTPAPAGHDAFPFQLVETHLAGCWGSMGEHRQRFLALGEHDSGNGSGPQFNMTALALRTAARVNAVSALHGEVTRAMWHGIWPDRAEADVPVQAITNGVHLATWISPYVLELFNAHLGSDWLDHQDDPALWDRLQEIPDEALWRVRQQMRADLSGFVRDRLRERWTDEHVGPARTVSAGAMLDPQALTIGYARRFTAYKRPELLFHDADRLARILTAAGRPVQIVFAGKAHPADDPAKHHLQSVFRHTLDPRFGGRLAFIDDYDLHVAHYLVQGCDVWLNTPRKPLEASGTSGMKASMNGVPHLSIGDGWWAEGYTGGNGWIIDGGAPADDHAAADAADAEALYRLLEEAVVPAFYDRPDGTPRRWLQVVREAMRSTLPRFSTRRMLKQYVSDMYTPLTEVAARSE